jgi:hypothetical protein
LISSLVYDHCTSTSSCSAESELSITATGRQKYFLEAGLTVNGRLVGGILYYDIENYLISYMEYLYQVTPLESNFCKLCKNFVFRWVRTCQTKIYFNFIQINGISIESRSINCSSYFSIFIDTGYRLHISVGLNPFMRLI